MVDGGSGFPSNGAGARVPVDGRGKMGSGSRDFASGNDRGAGRLRAPFLGAVRFAGAALRLRGTCGRPFGLAALRAGLVLN